MNYPLLINAALCLVMGCALLMAWRHDPGLAFGRYLGWSNLLQTLLILGYGLTLESLPLLSAAGKLLLPLASAGYTVLMVAGLGHLAARQPPRAWLVGMFLAIMALNATAVALQAVVWAHAASASINTLVGLACTYWFYKTNTDHFKTPDHLIGPLLVALGLNEFIFVSQQNEGLALQASIDSLLRVALGLVLLYAALLRTSSESLQLKDRLSRLKERMHQGILIVQSEKVVYANPACLKIYGVYHLQDLSMDMVLKTIPKAEQRGIGEAFKQVQNGQQNDLTYEGLRQRKDGQPMWLRCQLFRSMWGGSNATQILISDETKRNQTTQALLVQVLHDELTGLPNRVSLLNCLRERCDPNLVPQKFVLVLIDIDRFKLFNEAHGHSMGDEVLKAFSQALRKAVDARHAVMHMGGDEFALVSGPDTNSDTAVALAATVRQMLGAPLKVAGRDLFLDASMGIALYPHSAKGAESMLRAANAALHVAKRTPGTSHQLAEKEFERGSSNALEQEQALRAGIDSAEFHLMFQPKVNAYTGKLTSFEALARWNRPSVGQVSPLEFISASERTGLISALGTTLLKQACRQIAAWLDHYGNCVPIAVNVSPLQLLDPSFPTLVAQILGACHVPPRYLTLEISESSAVQDLEQTVLQIAQLDSLGVHVAMDDFGTGFSSLSMLRTLRLHTVKIDRSLVTPLPSTDAVAVVQAICQLAEALQLQVIAEGVETEEQAAAARAAGCAELQGYLYAMPLDVEDAAAWLEQSLRGDTQPG